MATNLLGSIEQYYFKVVDYNEYIERLKQYFIALRKKSQ